MIAENISSTTTAQIFLNHHNLVGFIFWIKTSTSDTDFLIRWLLDRTIRSCIYHWSLCDKTYRNPINGNDAATHLMFCTLGCQTCWLPSRLNLWYLIGGSSWRVISANYEDYFLYPEINSTPDISYIAYMVRAQKMYTQWTTDRCDLHTICNARQKRRARIDSRERG